MEGTRDRFEEGEWMKRLSLHCKRSQGVGGLASKALFFFLSLQGIGVFFSSWALAKPSPTSSLKANSKIMKTERTKKGNNFFPEMSFSFPMPPQKVLFDRKQFFSKNLSHLKELEKEKKWESCRALAEKEFQGATLVKDWVLSVWVHCVQKKMEGAFNVAEAEALLETVEQNKNVIFESLSQDRIFAGAFQIHLALAESYQNQPRIPVEKAQKNLGVLLSYGGKLDRETRSKVYYSMGVLAQYTQQFLAAKQFLEQSLLEKENRPGRERLNAVLLALPSNKDQEDGKTSSGKLTESETTNLVNINDGEKKAEEKLDQSSRNRDALSYIEEGIAYLEHFPNGRRAKVVQDKILEFYNEAGGGLSDKQQFIESRKKFLLVMGKADPHRQLDWARVLHRRGDNQGALMLLEKALPIFRQAPQSGFVFWLMGRSAQFLGEYGKAQSYFEQYLEYNSGGEELSEVQFRLALVYIRQKKFSSAIATLERLLLKKGDKFELNARYWFVRALELDKNPRSREEAKILMDQFPFSYYGMRLRADEQQGRLSFPANLKKGASFSTKIYLNPEQQRILKKVSILSVNGWVYEAQQEIAQFSLVKDPLQKMAFARLWKDAKNFPMVIKLVNEAGDLDVRLKTLDDLAVAFPSEFQESIDREARQNKLAPILVKSLIRQESAFGMHAVSSANALGLMQLIPPTVEEVAQSLRLGKLDVPQDVFDPEINIRMGSFYLAKMINKFGGNVPLGLAAYNAGPQRLQPFVSVREELRSQTKSPNLGPLEEIWFDELPWSETSFYIKAILRNVLIYKILENGSWQLGPVIWSGLAQQPAVGP